MTRAASVLAAVCAFAPALAAAAPKVGVVVVAHEGFTEADSDEIAYDVAAAVAQRIEGEAIAAGSVRALLPDGVKAGCEEQPVCGRTVAATLKTDEVLFLALKRGPRKEVLVVAHRVARDPERIPADQEIRLPGGKTKRERELNEAIATLYPTGSVVEYVEPPPPPPPPPVAAPAPALVEKAPAREGDSVTRRKWFWPVVGVAGAIVVGGIIAISVVESRPGPTGPAVLLP